MTNLDSVKAYREYRDHALCSHSYASPKAFAEHADAAIEALEAELERLKVCGNCGDCVDPDDDGVFWCEENTYLAIRGDEPCNFTPSRWTERGAE